MSLAFLILDQYDDIDKVVDHYDSALTGLLDVYAPSRRNEPKNIHASTIDRRFVNRFGSGFMFSIKFSKDNKIKVNNT